MVNLTLLAVTMVNLPITPTNLGKRARTFIANWNSSTKKPPLKRRDPDLQTPVKFGTESHDCASPILMAFPECPPLQSTHDLSKEQISPSHFFSNDVADLMYYASNGYMNCKEKQSKRQIFVQYFK